jgi:hypothetical protein
MLRRWPILIRSAWLDWLKAVHPLRLSSPRPITDRDLTGHSPGPMTANPSESMNLDVIHPAPFGAGTMLQAYFQPKPDAFERLPMNLSDEEIREMVLEVMG